MGGAVDGAVERRTKVGELLHLMWRGERTGCPADAVSEGGLGHINEHDTHFRGRSPSRKAIQLGPRHCNTGRAIHRSRIKLLDVGGPIGAEVRTFSDL